MSNSPEVRSAQEWYNNISKMKATNSSAELFFNNPKWRFIGVSQFNNFKVVENDLTDVIKLDFLDESSADRFLKNPDDWKYFHSVSRLVIITDPNNNKCGFIMTLIPSKEYIDKHYDRLSYNTYLHREPNYDGSIIFHDLNGSLTNGWIYSEGKIIKRLTKITDNNIPDKTQLYPIFRNPGEYMVVQKSKIRSDSEFGFNLKLDEIVVEGRKRKSSNGQSNNSEWSDRLKKRRVGSGSNLNTECMTISDDDDSGGGGVDLSPLTPEPIILEKESFKKSNIKKIYDRLMESSNLMQKIQQMFLGKNAVGNLILSVEKMKGSAFAKTYPPGNTEKNPGNFNTHIAFNEDEINKLSDILQASVVIHEMVHARVHSILLSESKHLPIVNMAVVDEKYFNHDYPGLHDYFQRFQQEAQHEYIAANYINIFCEIMTDFDPNYSNDECEALIWMGLQGTKQWSNLGSDRQQRIIQIYNRIAYR